MKKKVVLGIYQAGGSYGLTLSRDVGKNGEGYRVFGPKLFGQSENLREFSMGEIDIDRLIQELEESKRFLKDEP